MPAEQSRERTGGRAPSGGAHSAAHPAGPRAAQPAPSHRIVVCAAGQSPYKSVPQGAISYNGSIYMAWHGTLAVQWGAVEASCEV